MDPVTGEAGGPSAESRGLFHDRAPDQVVAALMAIVVTALALAWAADILHLVGLTSLYTGQMVALVLGLSCALIFLRRPAFGDGLRHTAPWYDRLFALAAAVAGVFLSIRFPVLYEDAFYHPVEVMVVSAVLVPLVLECLRRATGWSLLLVVAVFACYALWGDVIPGKLQGRTMGIGELVSYVGLDTTAMLGRPIIIAVTIVIVFIFLGRLLLESGAADFFTDVSAALLGRSRGGSAKIAVAASAMFGSVSGSAVSNVATTGILTIPMMCKGGYTARAAAAIEAVASTGGQLAPPVMGAAAFLMAEFLQLPYRDIVVAAVIPSLLFYAAVFIQTDLEAARRGVKALDESAIPKLRAVARAGWHLIAP
ncbi:MAG: TRAP transporter fused permease subunit, partial [Bauldia litoralis]